jgi:hypothetical protein
MLKMSIGECDDVARHRRGGFKLSNFPFVREALVLCGQSRKPMGQR